MSVAPTMTTTENTEMVQFPAFKKNGRINENYLPQLGAYFENHFAFRNWLVSINSKLMGKLGVSSSDKVVVGKKGWLYYASTLDDYLGSDPMSERELYNLSRNLSIVQNYVEEKGKRFEFTIAPNKNSLYDQNMPYYYGKKVSDKKNADRLQALLKEKGVNYTDLFKVFRSQDEILYCQRDSHWNNKGAVLAYNTILDGISKEHEDLAEAGITESYDYVGDLNRMLYPKLAVPEKNYEYDTDSSWEYEEGESAEELWSVTVNSDSSGTLLMYRDSFGITLLPLMADTYENGVFVNEFPYDLEYEMEAYEPDDVIVEKVERNLDEYLNYPPIITAPRSSSNPADVPVPMPMASLDVQEDEDNPDYYKLSGKIDPSMLADDSDILITIQDGNKKYTCEAYGIHEDQYAMYIKYDLIENEEITVTISVTDGDEIKPVYQDKVELVQIETEEDFEEEIYEEDVGEEDIEEEEIYEEDIVEEDIK